MGQNKKPIKDFCHGATYYTWQGKKLLWAFGLTPLRWACPGGCCPTEPGQSQGSSTKPGQSQGSSSSFRAAGSICREYSSKAAAQAMSGCIYFTDSGPVSFQGVQAVALFVFE